MLITWYNNVWRQCEGLKLESEEIREFELHYDLNILLWTVLEHIRKIAQVEKGIPKHRESSRPTVPTWRPSKSVRLPLLLAHLSQVIMTATRVIFCERFILDL
jgi:hypothetical protein